MSRPFGTLVENFYYWEAQTPNNVFLKQPQGSTFRDFTFAESGKQARKIASAILAMNLPPNSHIGIVSKNCAHWILADLAIAMAGHISVPFYPTLTAEQLHQVLVHANCKVLFVGKLDTWDAMKEGVPAGIKCIAFPTYYEGSPAIFENWDALLDKFQTLSINVSPKYDAICTVVYTSGTTGVPKGVMLTHGAFVEALNHTKEVGLLEMSNTRFFSYLPLCHIAERNIVEAAGIATGGTIYFAENIDSFQKNLEAAQPTHFLAVPRIWTKFQLGILSKIPQKRLTLLLKLPLLNTLIKRKIKQGLGLAKAKIILTGAAPMPTSLLQWFQQLDITIQEAYGMTENMGLTSLMPLNAVKSGTVGKPHKGVHIRINPNTQEIQMQSPWNTLGYYKEPVLTEELFHEGWLCTGDMGTIDEDGYLKIIGRVKDMFKSSKGEYIVPTRIESLLAVNPIIEQVCVVGSGLPQPIALVVLSEFGHNTSREVLIDTFSTILERVNPHFNNYEHLQKMVIVKQNWSVENGILTPTLKVKRNVIEAAYKDRIFRWYNISEKVVFE